MIQVAKAGRAVRLQSIKLSSLSSRCQSLRCFTSNEFKNIEDAGDMNTKKSTFDKMINMFAKFQDAPRTPGSLILIRHGSYSI